MLTVYQPRDAHPEYPIQSHPMRHVFVVLGEETLFLCHLINWWMEGHNSALVLRVSLEDQHEKVLLADKKRHRAATYFLANPRGTDPTTGT